MTEGRVTGSMPERLGSLGRVLDKDGEPAGTCFQVAPGVLVTTWNVLDGIGLAEADTPVSVDPLGGGQAFSGLVKRLDPLHDLAVIVTDSPLQTVAGPLVETDGVRLRTEVSVTGYAAFDDPGHTYRFLEAVGAWAGGTTRDDQIPLGRVTSDGVLPGMSGAPVVRDSDGAVVGVVSGRYNSADGWLAGTVWVARTEDLTALLAGIGDVAFEAASDTDGGRSAEGSTAALVAVQTFDTGAAVAALAISELDGRAVAVSGGEDGALRVWDLATGNAVALPLVGHKGPIWAVALGQLDGRTIAASGGADATVRVWDLATGQATGSPMEGHADAVNSVALGTLGGRPILVSASDDLTLRIWDTANGQLISTLTGHSDWVNSVALGVLEGRSVAVSGSTDQTVRVWDLADSQLISTLTGHTESVSSVALGVLEGRSVAVSGSTDQTVRVWDLADSQLISTLTGHEGRVRAVGIGAVAGWPLAVSGGNDQTVRLWDLANSAPFDEIMADHEGAVRAVGITVLHDRPTVISGGDDGTIRSWTPRTEMLQRDQVEWLSDSPAHSDLLHRRPLAQALATRLRRFYDEDPDISFLMHIDGPWGTGKSTLANLLRSELAEDWLTVDFDAWRQSRIGPPWWALLAALRRELAGHLSLPRKLWLRLAESWARARRAGAPFAFALILLLTAAALVFVLLRPGKLTFSSAGDLAVAVTAVIAALGTLWTGALVAARFLLWDSARGARLFEQSNSNPMQDIVDHFAWLITKAKRPVVFLVDDLDRCPQTYVVDFLEAVQTLIRDTTKRAGVRSRTNMGAASFVISADGAWIRRSYEVAFDTFESSVGEPGRPLGYLFLDKLFQLRVPVPSIDPRRQREYLSELLKVRRPDQVTQLIAAEERSVRDRLHQSATETEIVETLRSASPAVRDRVAAAAVQRLTTPEVAAATEHALQRFVPLLVANPRSMKRFINDYSILRAVRTLEGNPVRSQPLALWAILGTQWPALADYLRVRPEAIEQLGNPIADLDNIPAVLRSLFGDPNVRRLADFEHGGPLTPELIRSCCGGPALVLADESAKTFS